MEVGVGMNAFSALISLLGDRYLRCILFFSCFIPLGAYYSVDYALQRHYPKRECKSVQ